MTIDISEEKLAMESADLLKILLKIERPRKILFGRLILMNCWERDLLQVTALLQVG